MRKVFVITGIVLLWLFFYPWHTGLGPGPNFAVAETAGQPGALFYDTLNFWNMKAGSLRVEKLRAQKIAGQSIDGQVVRAGQDISFQLARASGRHGMLTLRFDDGYKDVLTVAAPLLAQYGVRGVVAIIVGELSKYNENYLSWRDLRKLVNVYGWEVACHGMQSKSRNFDWATAYEEMVKSKKMLEDSLNVPVTTWIAPAGNFGGLDDFFLRRYYTAGVKASGGYNKPSLDPYRLNAQKWDPQLVADSGYWAIRFWHQASGHEEEIESTIVQAQRYGIEIVTIREGIARMGGNDLSPIRITFGFDCDSSMKWIGLEKDIENFAGVLSEFEAWQNGMPVGWIIEGTTDSIWADTFSSGQGALIPSATHFAAYLEDGDTLILRRYFDTKEIPYALLRFFIPVWVQNGLGGSYWALHDTLNKIWWDDNSKIWVSSETHNTFNTSFPSGCREWNTHINVPVATTLEFIVFASNQLGGPQEFDFDDLCLFPTTSIRTFVKLEFVQPHFDATIESHLDFTWDNGVGPVLISPNGTKYRLKVDDSGNLSTERIP